MNQNLQQVYQEKSKFYQSKHAKVKQKINFISFVRFVEFVLGVSLIFIFAEEGQQGLAFFVGLIFGLVFLYLVKVHADFKLKKAHLERLIKVNQDELNALQGKITHFADGSEFVEDEHPFMYDLDILGHQSIFQYLNRTTTIIGKKSLATSLTQPNLNTKHILQRQKAVADLKDKLDFRQEFRASGMALEENESEKEKVLTWIKTPINLKNKAFYRVLLILFPTLTIATIVLGSLNFIQVRFVFIPILIQLGIVSLHLKSIITQSSQISLNAKFLRKYTSLLELIEVQKFESELLKNAKQKLQANNKKASENLKNLVNIIDRMEQGGSLVGLVFNGVLMWSLQYLYRLEKWQRDSRTNFEAWFGVIAEVDELSSIANLHYNYPHYIFPEIAEDKFTLKAKDAGHPLLDAKQRVNNPIEVEGLGQIILITGANMAGKSTYLRTVGVNLTLAMAGSVVCAKSFVFAPIALYTSMRTKDSLQSSESFFYAELKKLKKVIDVLSENKPIFVILDEILKGTNSADQHTGSKALIEQLVALNGVGMIATHDISLGELAQKYPQNIKNRCFEITIKNDELDFDYKLREGINQNLNATFLMKKMGITV